MTRRGRYVWGTVGVLVAIVVLVVISFDWNWLKPPLEARLSAATGKTVKISGPIQGEWSWTPLVTFEKVQISEPDWKPDPMVAKVDQVRVRLDIKRLFSGVFALPEIDITRPVFNLARKPDGTANRDIASEANGPSSSSGIPEIGELNVRDGRLIYSDPAKHVSIDAVISTIHANGGKGGGQLTIEGQGQYQKAPFTLKVRGGSIEALRDSRTPYEVHLASTVGATQATIDGTVTDIAKLADMDIKLTIQGDNTADLYPLIGVAAPQSPPYRLAGRLGRDGKVWVFQNISGKVGDSDLEGTLRFDMGRERLFIGGDLKSEKVDFRDLGPLIGLPGATEQGKTASNTQRKAAAAYQASDRVLPDATLNLDAVRNVDADVKFSGKSVQAQDLPLQNVDLHLVLDNALLSLKPLRLGVAGGEIASDITINAREAEVTTDYDVRFRGFQIQQFFDRGGYSQGGSGTVNGRIVLKGTGDSVRKSLATANGEVSAISADGTFSKLLAELLGLDVARALGVLVIGDEKIPLRCFVADFEVKDGIMNPRTFVIDTSEATTTGTGLISLRDEQLDLSLLGRPKSASPLSLGGPIEVGGKFKKPRVGLGAQAIARGGIGAALGVLLTPLAAIVAFIDPGTQESTDCAALEQSAKSHMPSRRQ